MSKPALRMPFVDVAGAAAHRRLLNQMRSREATELTAAAARKRKQRAEAKKAALREMLEPARGEL